jgi:hypothetical protein
MRHGRTHSQVSLLSDDSSDGMLPVRRLLPKELHASGSRRPSTASEQAVQHCPDGAPRYERVVQHYHKGCSSMATGSHGNETLAGVQGSQLVQR